MELQGFAVAVQFAARFAISSTTSGDRPPLDVDAQPQIAA
jgi:hypothetical protein